MREVLDQILSLRKFFEVAWPRYSTLQERRRRHAGVQCAEGVESGEVFVGEECRERRREEGMDLGFSSPPKTLRGYGTVSIGLLGPPTSRDSNSGSRVVRRPERLRIWVWGVMSKGLGVVWSSVIGDSHVILRSGRMEGSDTTLPICFHFQNVPTSTSFGLIFPLFAAGE
jgi:hypothetical protein